MKKSVIDLYCFFRYHAVVQIYHAVVQMKGLWRFNENENEMREIENVTQESICSLMETVF